MKFASYLVVVSISLAGMCPTVGANAMKSWNPGGGSTLRHTTVCHDDSGDAFGIAVVFQFHTSFGDAYDRLYYVRVEGSSSSSSYGDIIDSRFLRSDWRIDHVDCTADSVGNVFVAYDRWRNHAQWYRINATSVFGPFSIMPGDGCRPYTHRPRIALGGGSTPRLIAAYDGHHFKAPEWNGCEVCTQQFDPYTGAAIAGSDAAVWNDGMSHSDYDVEWNGVDGFILALPYAVDAGTSSLGTYVYDVDGDLTASYNIQNFFTTPTPAYPSRVQLIQTYNYWGDLLLQTDTGTYLIESYGNRFGPLVESNSGARFVGCQYAGSTHDSWFNAVANIFTPEIGFVGTFPAVTLAVSIRRTIAEFFSTGPSYWDSAQSNTGYYPMACAQSATSDTELLLVSRSVPTSGLFWTLEPSL